MSRPSQSLEALRFRFLERLYDLADGDITKRFPLDEIGDQIEASASHRLSIVRFLHEKRLIVSDIGNNVAITNDGMVAVEEARQVPDRPTPHFGALNIILVGNMSESAIQQGASGSMDAAPGNLLNALFAATSDIPAGQREEWNRAVASLAEQTARVVRVLDAARPATERFARLASRIRATLGRGR